MVSAFESTIIALGLLSATPDEATRAKVLFEEGVALAKTEQWSDALAKFESSRALVARPSTLFNIGTTLLRLQRPTAAIQTFEQFVASSNHAAKNKAAKNLIAEARATLVEVELNLDPSDAALSIDGVSIATDAPVRLRLDPGTRLFEVTAEGFVSARETIPLEAGAHLTHTIALTPIAPPPPPPPPALPPPVAVAPIEAETEELPPESDSFIESPWTWIVAGAVVIGAAIGIGFAASHRGVADPTGGDTGDILHP